MSDSHDSFKEAIRRMENPYAKEQLSLPLQVAEPTPAALRLTDERRRAMKRMGNPYAFLEFEAIDDSEPREARTADAEMVQDGPRRSLTQREFETECRRIFRKYIPLGERGRLRPHHREFTERNLRRTPVERGLLVQALRAYDLPDLPGLQTLYNRERDLFTKEKLQRIEHSVLR
jgi:hypothetical protein